MYDPMILSFNLNPSDSERLSALCAGMGVSHRPVRRDEYGAPLGKLAALPGVPVSAIPGPDFQDRMLIMCFLDEERFNMFLQGLRFSGIPRIDLKAVLTPTNAAWTPGLLRIELSREHEEMKRRERERRKP